MLGISSRCLFHCTVCDLNDSDVIEGLAKEWIEHEQFMPSLEMCAGKVHTPHLQELTILKMPESFDIVDDDRVAAHYCIGTSVRRSSGRRSGVAVRAVDCWQ